MKISNRVIPALCFFHLISIPAFAQAPRIDLEKLPYRIYPDLNDTQPDLSSPFTSTTNQEFVIAVTRENRYAIIPVTISNERAICQQLIIDTTDFPQLAQTGLHSEERLNQINTITGRALDKITELGRPGALSQDGFLAQDENILSVIKGDNRIVSQMGLTHPQLARPLFHVLNMMDADLSLNRWNMAKHRWKNIQYFFYNNRKVFVEAEDTKGGQESIFDDKIEGAFYLKLWREFEKEEMTVLKDRNRELSDTEFDSLKTLLSSINTGEIEPQYIMRYGFYEGHTFWRTDPISVSFIFNIRTLEEIEEVCKGRLFEILTNHFTE